MMRHRRNASFETRRVTWQPTTHILKRLTQVNHPELAVQGT
jgi:hypothetical protein